MLKNPLLQKALDTIESRVDDKASFDKLVSAGLKTMFNKDIFANLTQGLPQSKDPIGDTAKGVVFIIGQLAKKARGTAPPPALVQAGFALLLNALDFEEQAGMIQVDKGELDEATHAFMDAMLPSLGLNQQRLGAVLAQLKQTASDPQKMAQFQQAVEAA